METLNTILNIEPNYIIIGLFVLFFSFKQIVTTPFKFKNRLKHLLQNIPFQVVLVVANYFFAMVLVYSIEWLNSNNIGLLYFVQLNEITRLIIGVVLYDITAYWIHRMTHRVPVFWRFHRVHHSDTSMDSSTFFRMHPVEVILVFGVGNILTAALFGTDLLSLALYYFILNLFFFLEHSNFKFPVWLDKTLGWVITTPNLHKIHHEQNQYYTDSNFADIFILWDRIFGTYKYLPAEKINYGLKEFDEEKKQTFPYLIISPFLNIERVGFNLKNMKIYIRKYLIILLTIALIPNTVKSQQESPVDVTIDNHGVTLKGKFYAVENKEGSFPTLILLQGFAGNGSDVLGLGKQLVQSNINVLTFINSGVAPSEGLFSFSNSLTDIKAAYQFVLKPENIARFKIDTTSIIIGGHSYGGGLAMTYAINHPEIKQVLSISGNDWGENFEEYVRNPDYKVRIDGRMDRLIESGKVKFETGGLPSEMVASGIDKIDPSLYLKRNAALLAPKKILLICGWDDNVVSIDRYILPLYRELQKEKDTQVKIKAFQDNHGFSNTRNELAKTIINWINEYREL